MFRLVPIAIAVMLSGYAYSGDTDHLVDLEIQPGVTSVTELVAEVGLPEKVEDVYIDGVNYKRFAYLTNPDSILSFTPLVFSSGPVESVDYSGRVYASYYAPSKEEALVCLISPAKTVVQCEKGSTKK